MLVVDFQIFFRQNEMKNICLLENICLQLKNNTKFGVNIEYLS